jgi:micrococcal nuclease
MVRTSGFCSTSVIAVLMVGICPARAQNNDCRLEPGPSRSVAKIIDSETLQLDDGKHVRLIGALGPRAVDVAATADTWPPEERAKAALSELVLSKSVTLAFGGDKTDRYGRWVAHVFVASGDAQVWVQGHMLQSGHARSYGISGNRACEAELIAHEKIARDANLGLWAEAAYQVRKPWPSSELTAFASTFQIISGRVTRVTEGREFTYLNFGRNNRWDFSAAIRISDRETHGRLGGDAKRLQGRHIEVRGWIEQRSGPMLDISIAGQIVEQPADAESSASVAAAPAAPRLRRSRAVAQPTPPINAERPAP